MCVVYVMLMYGHHHVWHSFEVLHTCMLSVLLSMRLFKKSGVSYRLLPLLIFDNRSKPGSQRKVFVNKCNKSML